MATGFRCPACGSYENHFLAWTFDDIECEACGNIFEASEVENEDNDY